MKLEVSARRPRGAVEPEPAPETWGRTHTVCGEKVGVTVWTAVSGVFFKKRLRKLIFNEIPTKAKDGGWSEKWTGV